MEYKIRCYVENIFKDVPASQRAYDMREEMIRDLIDKYHDLVSKGNTEEAAYNIVTLGIGDTDELLRELNVNKQPTMTDSEKKSRAIRTSIAISLYILSVVPLFLSDLLHYDPIIGLVLLFVFAAVATALLIYNGLTSNKRITINTEEDDSLPDGTSASRMRTYKAVAACIWPLTVAIYFVLSFTTGAWHITWVIFLISVAVQQIVRAIFSIRK